MRKSIVLLTILAASALSACDAEKPAANKSAGTPATQVTAAASPSTLAAAATAHGFTTGSLMAARTTYVYFDAQCSHCGHLWNAFKPLTNIKVVWIPVGLLNGLSTRQGAALLASAEPVKTMAEHEVKLAVDHTGMSAPSATKEQEDVIKANTKLFMATGSQSVPLVLGTNAVTGATFQRAGAMTTAELRTTLGLHE